MRGAVDSDGGGACACRGCKDLGWYSRVVSFSSVSNKFLPFRPSFLQLMDRSQNPMSRPTSRGALLVPRGRPLVVSRGDAATVEAPVLEEPKRRRLGSASLLRARAQVGDALWQGSDIPSPQKKMTKTVAAACNPRAVCPVIETPSNLYGVVMRLAKVSQTDTLLDIGCGEGQLLAHAASRNGCRCVGIDVRPECLEAVSRRAEDVAVAHLVQAVESDMMDLAGLTSLPCWSEATVIYAYLLPHLFEHLAPALIAAVDAGKRVVLYSSTGSRVRRPDAPKAGNVIRDLVPAGEAMLGRLRLYCRADVLAALPQETETPPPPTMLLGQRFASPQPLLPTPPPAATAPPILPACLTRPRPCPPLGVERPHAPFGLPTAPTPLALLPPQQQPQPSQPFRPPRLPSLRSASPSSLSIAPPSQLPQLTAGGSKVVVPTVSQPAATAAAIISRAISPTPAASGLVGLARQSSSQRIEALLARAGVGGSSQSTTTLPRGLQTATFSERRRRYSSLQSI